jgi:hypothetical protein
LPSLLPKNTNIKICRIIILPVVLDECETRPLTLREEYRLRAIGNTVLRNIFGSKRDHVTGGDEKRLHNEELLDWYCSLNIIRVIRSWMR